jgi:hypothetical protein
MITVTSPHSTLTAENQRLLLEVQHREQSFQMVFKRSPNVGKLNPLASPRPPARAPSMTQSMTSSHPAFAKSQSVNVLPADASRASSASSSAGVRLAPLAATRANAHHSD